MVTALLIVGNIAKRNDLAKSALTAASPGIRTPNNLKNLEQGHRSSLGVLHLYLFSLEVAFNICGRLMQVGSRFVANATYKHAQL